MEPLYFGGGKRRLFGVHDPPVGRPRGVGVVMCAPLPQEYHLRLYELRRLAERLAREGFDVLRFDWSGTGDSGGELAEATAERWCEDVRLAAAELRELAGVRKISALGLRLGGALAARCVADGLAVRDLVLWDAPVTGAEHVKELVALEPRMWAFNNVPGRSNPEELLGFHFPPGQRASFEALDLSQLGTIQAERVLVFTPGRLEAADRLRRALRDRQGREPTVASVTETSPQAFGFPVMATQMVHAIVEAMSGATP